jgi:tartrate-resistant acid phosphatase type 5
MPDGDVESLLSTSRRWRPGNRQSLLSCLVFISLLHHCGSYTRIVAVGDFGASAYGGAKRQAAAQQLIHDLDREMRLDGIIAMGDINYPTGQWSTMDRNIAPMAHYIWPLGPSNLSQGAPDRQNRFYPCPGNHDWIDRSHGPLYAYFKMLPWLNGSFFYDVRITKDVHVFSLDSDTGQDKLNGTHYTSKQAMWLKRALAASDAPWKIVMFHHPPYSSGRHGSTNRMKWPFLQWGASAVISGHDHSYERVLHHTGFPYFVNGLGGASLTSFGGSKEAVQGSVAQFSGSPGVQLIEADETRISFRLIPMQLTKKKLGRWMGSSTHWRHIGSPYDCYQIIKEESEKGVRYDTCLDRFIKFAGGPEPNASWLAFNHSAGIMPMTKVKRAQSNSSRARGHRQKGSNPLLDFLGLFNWLGPIKAGRRRI